MTHARAASVTVPPGAWDCHFHVFDPAYSLAATASAPAPQHATLADYRKVQAELGLTRTVLVQSTAYGFDNRCMLSALAELGPQGRGVVTLAPDVDDVTLAQLHASGVRGVRFMMLNQPVLSWDALAPMAERIAPLGWHVNLQMDGADFPQRLPQLAKLPVPLVIDHNGKFLMPPAIDAPEFRALRSLLDGGRCWVKLSAPYETSRTGAPDYADVSLLARTLAQAYPQRCVWASNWPHVGRATPPRNAELLRLLHDWAPDADAVRRILVDNPQQLYGL
jgi:D-galactarolactone isomerase